MSFQPSYDISGDPDAPNLAFVLHGILGSRRNWSSFTRRLVAAAPGWRFARIDHRGHGDSSGAPGPHTVSACADDLARLTTVIGQPTVMIGHSFGGKVALDYAQRHRGPLEHVWALDSAVGITGDPITQHVTQVIETARAMPLPAPDREAVIDWFVAHGNSRTLARWMTTNLRRGSDGYIWRFELDTIELLLADYWRVDLWPFLEALPPGLTAHILRAERSERWTPEVIARLEALPNVTAPLLADSGHWVQMDAPDGLLAHLITSLG